MSISLRQGIGIRKCCKGGSLIPSPPPDACPLVLDGVGDSLTWADPRATAITPFNLNFGVDFWFKNNLATARDFTVLSFGKEISGVLYDTIELKYNAAGNKLIVEIIADITGTPSVSYAEFELHSASNAAITGFVDINDKWIECGGNSSLHGAVHLFLSIPEPWTGTTVIDASYITLWWNGQLLTASATQSNTWDLTSAYYTNFITLGDYRGATTPATSNAAEADIFWFVLRDTYFANNYTLPATLYNNGYPPVILNLNQWYAYGIVSALPTGSTGVADLIRNSDPTLSPQLNDNAALVCGPVSYTCATAIP